MFFEVKRKIILLPHGMQREIARQLQINERTVGRALRGETVGSKSEAARRAAIEMLHELYGEEPAAVAED